ncbi:hypothetical protein ACFWXA_35565 [Streptomyces atroolivaceus]|uniref:hypothetical protein n=1 Tax=Streptomyces atroolivaceus TaxID=66869 RepID=UPI003663960C
MPESLPSQSDPEEAPSVPAFAPPIPWLAAGMDEEEAELTMGVGLLVREAALLEYTLHGLLVHLAGAPRAYAYEAGGTGSFFAKRCIESLKAIEEDPVPSASREALLEVLERCKEQFESRHRFVHGHLQFDHESQQWLTLKSRRGKGARHAEVRFTTSSEPWELAAGFHWLQEKVLWWDIKLFGEPGDPDEGEPAYVSVKR